MASQFQLKTLFEHDELTNLVQNYGFRRMTEQEIELAIQSAFSDYILSALSEQSDSAEDNKKLYIEAVYHLDKASLLLSGKPHPAGRMSYRLSNMIDTLNKIIEGKVSMAAERATRFMEKNLVRRLRDIWCSNTSTPFHAYGDGSGHNPRDFLINCLRKAGNAYPEISWFNDVDSAIADQLIKSIKR